MATIARSTARPSVWQSARSLGEYTLVTCAVGSGFDFADFELLASSEAERRRLDPHLGAHASLI